MPDEPQCKRTLRFTDIQGIALLLAIKHNTLDVNSCRGDFTLSIAPNQAVVTFMLSLKCLLHPIIRDSTLGSSIFGWAQRKGFCVPTLCSKRGASSIVNG